MKAAGASAGILAVFVAGLTLLYAWYIWPTPYEYQTMAGISARANRFTNKGEVLIDGRWTLETGDALSTAVIEADLKHWRPGAANQHAPPAALRCPQVDITREWFSGGIGEGPSTRIILTPSSHGRFRVGFSTGGCLMQWHLNRTGRFVDGVLLLDMPVQEYGSDPYQRLYAVRVAETEYLVPDVRADAFTKALSPDGKRVTNGIMLDIVAFRRAKLAARNETREKKG